MNIRELFVSMSYQTIRDYITNGQQEGLHLEFKMVGDSSLRARDDRKNLAKAMSGFANSSGGIVVWGVDARKNPDGIDSAQSIHEIDNVDVLISRLNQLTGQATEPIVSGVLHRSLTTEKGRGIAATLVPESEAGPHMAKLGEDRYYKRSGDSFYMMEHFDIADMFGKRSKPKLVIYSRPRRGADSEIVVGLRNEGRGSAIAPFLSISCSKPYMRNIFGLDGNHREGLPRLVNVSGRYEHSYGGTHGVTIHPGMELDVAAFWLGMNNLPVALPEAVTFNYALAAEGQPFTEGIERMQVAAP